MNIDNGNNFNNQLVSAYNDKLSSQKQAVFKAPVGSVPPENPNSIMGKSKAEDAKLNVDWERVEAARKKYQKNFEWYTDDSGELRVKLKDAEGKVLQYIPPEKLDRVLKDIAEFEGKSIGNLVNEVV